MRLSDLCTLIVDCEHKTAPAGDGSAYSVGTGDIRGGRINLAGAKRVSDKTFAEWTAREVPRDGDLILTREAPVGEVGRVAAGQRICLGQRTVLLRPDPARVEPRFLHYLLLSRRVQSSMHALATGATVAHLNVADIRDLDVGELPLRDEQTRVASLLGALDDKIGLNGRLRERIDHALGAIYELHISDATSRVLLGGVASIEKRTIRPSEFPAELFNHFSIAAFDGGEWPLLSPGASMLSAKTLIEGPGRVLISKLNPATKRVWLPQIRPDHRAVCSTEFVVLRPESETSSAFLFCSLKSDRMLYDEILSHATGTTTSRQRVKPQDVLSCRTVSLTPSQLGAFEDVVNPYLQLSASVGEEAVRLAEARDLLLDWLIGDLERQSVATDELVVSP